MNYLLVSHGNRILFFLQKYFSSSYEKHLGNGAVILLTMKRKYTTVEMLYQGYAPTNNFFQCKTFFKSSIPTKALTKCYIYRTTCFYIVRHGIAEHNVIKTPTILFRKDTHLVPSGKRALRKSIAYLPKKFNGVFCSPLVRTRQTAEVLLKNYPNRTINIVPSASEILFRYFPFINVNPNYPDQMNHNFPKGYYIQWQEVQRKKNMIDEILNALRKKKSKQN